MQIIEISNLFRQLHLSFWLLTYSNIILAKKIYKYNKKYRASEKFSCYSQLISLETQLLYFLAYFIRYSTNELYFNFQFRNALIPLKCVQIGMPFYILMLLFNEKKYILAMDNYILQAEKQRTKNINVDINLDLNNSIIDNNKKSYIKRVKDELKKYKIPVSVYILIIIFIVALIIQCYYPTQSISSMSPYLITKVSIYLQFFAFVPQLVKYYTYWAKQRKQKQLLLMKNNKDYSQVKLMKMENTAYYWLVVLAISKAWHCFQMQIYVYYDQQYFWFAELLCPISISVLLTFLHFKNKHQKQNSIAQIQSNQIRQSFIQYNKQTIISESFNENNDINQEQRQPIPNDHVEKVIK